MTANLVPPGTIPRPRIENVLREALKTAPVIALQAPLGSGKSTVLASVLADRNDATLFEAQPWHRANFVEDLIQSVRTVRPDFGRRTLGATGAGADGAMLGELFIADLRHVPASLVIAIDNAEHFIDDQSFAQFFDTVAHGLSSNVRLIISGRALPPISLASLLLRKRALKIPAELLAFTTEEVAVALGAAVDSRAAEDIVRDTGGWAASVSLALSGPREGRSGATQELALQYLNEALVAKLDPETLRFFECTAVFERIERAVLVRVSEYGEFDSFFERLERAGTPFTRDGSIYRMHPLVRVLALEQLHARGAASEAHALAARAYARSGNLSAALFHVTQSGDASVVDAFMREHGESVVRTGNHEAIRAATNLLSNARSDDIRSYLTALLEKDRAGEEVERLLSRATASEDARIAFASRAAEIERKIGRGVSFEAQELDALQSCALPLGPGAQAQAAMLSGWASAVRFDFRGALETIAPLRGVDDSAARFNTGILYAYAQTARGEVDEALKELDALVRLFENDDRIVFQTLTLVWQARLALLLGRTAIAADAARASLRLIEALPLRAEEAALYVALAELATHEGDVVQSLRFAELSRTSSSRAWYARDIVRARSFAELALARAAFLGGDFATARDLARRVADDDESPLPSRALAYAENAMYAVLADSDGRAGAERACAVLGDASPQDAADAVGLTVAYEVLEFLDAVCAWKLPLPRVAALAPFAGLVDARRGVVTPIHAAIALENVRRGTANQDGFDTALAQMSRYGDRFEIRLFRAYASREIAPRKVAKTELFVELTARELEILSLLVDGLSNKEIAQRLVLSPRTVETHVERVLGKLEVGSRSRAIAKALRLGLVDLN